MSELQHMELVKNLGFTVTNRLSAHIQTVISSHSQVLYALHGVHAHGLCDKGEITSKIKHAIKLKTSPARLAQLPSLEFCFSVQFYCMFYFTCDCSLTQYNFFIGLLWWLSSCVNCLGRFHQCGRLPNKFKHS